MKLAIYPGSFDPVTYGHLEIIERAAKLFDKLIVLVSLNPLKPTVFTLQERKDFLTKVTSKIPNVEVDAFEGLLINYFKEKEATAIVKGLRAMSDFEYEFQMALVNKDLCNNCETVFLSANVASTFLSSSMVKQIAMFGGDISAFVPSCILNDITQRLTLRKDV